jgi:hypothetical protein
MQLRDFHMPRGTHQLDAERGSKDEQGGQEEEEKQEDGDREQEEEEAEEEVRVAASPAPRKPLPLGRAKRDPKLINSQKEFDYKWTLGFPQGGAGAPRAPPAPIQCRGGGAGPGPYIATVFQIVATPYQKSEDLKNCISRSAHNNSTRVFCARNSARETVALIQNTAPQGAPS